MQDNCFHFFHHFCKKVAWQSFISFSKMRANFKITDLPLKMSSKALNYVSWKCCFKSSFCLNVVPHCEQAYCFQPLWSNTCCVLALKQKVYAFSHHGALLFCALKQQATWHACKVLEGQSYIEQNNCFHFLSLLFSQGWVKAVYFLFS